MRKMLAHKSNVCIGKMQKIFVVWLIKKLWHNIKVHNILVRTFCFVLTTLQDRPFVHTGGAFLTQSLLLCWPYNR